MAKTMEDAFVPECSSDGSYADVQCFEHEGFAKQCWCVTKDGQEIQGTRMSDGQTPNCAIVADKVEENKQEPKQHDGPKKINMAVPSGNGTKFEVEVEVTLNDTIKGEVIFEKKLCVTSRYYFNVNIQGRSQPKDLQARASKFLV